MDPQMLETIEKMNEIYRRLEYKGRELCAGLHHRIFEPQLRYYSGHYRRLEDGSFVVDDFPIPVVEVKGYCDVEINLDCVTVSSKLHRDQSLAYGYEKLARYDFEAYGVEGFCNDFYHAGMTVAEMKDNIQKSDEKEIGFSFCFDFAVDGDTIYEFVKLLRREGFYY